MSKQKINMSIMNTMGVMSPMIPFNCLIDTDFGLLNLIYREYFDKSVFSEDFFYRHNKINQLVSALYYREYENPIMMIMKEPDTSIADDYYNQFMEKRYSDILKMSMPTDIIRIVRLLKLNGDAYTEICYERDEEVEIINKFPDLDKIKKIKLDDMNPKIVKDHSQFFFKSVNDIYTKGYSPFLELKTIYLGFYKFNIDREENTVIGTPLVANMYMNHNKIELLDFYNRNNIPEDENE